MSDFFVIPNPSDHEFYDPSEIRCPSKTPEKGIG